MVCAWSHSFQRTIKGWLQWSLWWWPSLFSTSLYHQPTLLELYWTSVGIHPPIPLLSPTIIFIITITNQSHMTPTAAYLGPHRLHTCSMLHAHHPTHDTCSRGHEFSHHMASQGFESASFGKHQSMILFASCSILLPYVLLHNSFYFSHTCPTESLCSALAVPAISIWLSLSYVRGRTAPSHMSHNTKRVGVQVQQQWCSSSIPTKHRILNFWFGSKTVNVGGRCHCWCWVVFPL